jgi:Protein of unknown function DUF2834
MPWISEHGFNLALFFHELFANRVGGFFGLDVVVSAIVLIIFVQVEGRQLGMRRLWIPMVGTLLAGVSFGFPLFLYLRESSLIRIASRAKRAIAEFGPLTEPDGFSDTFHYLIGNFVGALCAAGKYVVYVGLVV